MKRHGFRLVVVAILVVIVSLQAHAGTTASPTSATDRISDLERRLSESEALVKQYAEQSANWAIWTLRLVGTLGTIAALLIAVGSVIGFLGARRVRKEAAEAAKVRMQMEAHFNQLTGSFLAFVKTIDVRVLLYRKEKLNPLEEERFKELDIQLLLAGILGAKVNAEVLEGLGWYWRTLGNLERALLRFERALALEPTRVNSIFGKGVCLCMMADKIEDKSKQSEMRRQALDHIDRAITDGPERHRYLFARGFLLDDMERFPEALEAYEAARRIDPGDLKITYNIACTYARSKKFPEALAELRKIRNEKSRMQDAKLDNDFVQLRAHPTYGQEFSEIVG